MAAKKYFANIDLNKNQIKNAVAETITQAAADSGKVTGQLIFDTGTATLKYYDGSNWQSTKTRFSGQILYKGAIGHDAASPESTNSGDLYVFTSPGTATNYGGGVVEIGDYVIYNGATTSWSVIQGNVVQSSTGVKGIVELATSDEAETGSDTARAIVPSALKAWADQTDKTVTRKRVFTGQTINSSPNTLTHAIGNNNPYVSVYTSTGQRVHLEITKGNGTVVLTSNVELSGATVVISA
jgi:hypothetical protein